MKFTDSPMMRPRRTCSPTAAAVAAGHDHFDAATGTAPPRRRRSCTCPNRIRRRTDHRQERTHPVRARGPRSKTPTAAARVPAACWRCGARCSASNSARFPPPTKTIRRRAPPDSPSRNASRRLSRETRRTKARGGTRRQSPRRALHNPRAGHRPERPEQKGRQRTRPVAMSSRRQIEPEIENQTWTGERSSLDGSARIRKRR